MQEPRTSDLRLAPVQEHLELLQSRVREIQGEFRASGLEFSRTKLEVAALDAQSKKNNDAESELFLLRIAELKKTFELGNQLDISENGFLKDQIASLTQDRFKIRQNSNLLDERLARVEELIGFPADATA